ncbi:MAG: phosphorylase [Acidobacteria bacterium]|nr:MAG: phosphorylase [Acidobacteriota bacterium]PYY18003.1 MAG: phosphorylase [Acidobacteriota bacterium]
MARVGIIAAMFREVHPLVRNMEPLKFLPDRRVQLYQSKNAVIAYAGMGHEPAAAAAHAALSTGEIDALVSVGWAGGLNPSAVAGKVVHPMTVIDSFSGKRYSAGGEGGTLVTVQLVAGVEEKRRLGEQYQGDYVDMEAAAVAQCAAEAGIPFHCFKAISDAHDARLPDMNRFNRNGQFSAWRFIAHIAVRPGLWRAVSDMSKASLDSRDALCRHLEQWIAERQVTRKIAI